VSSRERSLLDAIAAGELDNHPLHLVGLHGTVVGLDGHAATGRGRSQSDRRR
jgi:hypothetical protein